MSEPQPPQGAATPSPLRRQAPKRTPGYLVRRAWERTVYAGYRLLMWVIGILPPRPVEALFSARGAHLPISSGQPSGVLPTAMPQSSSG